MGHNVKDQASKITKHGADKVYLVDRPALKDFHVGPYTSVLAQLIQHHKPEILIIGSTKRGKGLASRLATRLETGCAPDCIELGIDETGRLVMSRIVYGGNAIATEICRVKPQIATVPPRVFDRPEPKEKGGKIVEVDVELEKSRTEVVEVRKIKATKVKVEEAKAIVSGGRGVEKKEDFRILEELAEVLGGQIGNSRPLAEDRKWFTEWIGLSGHKVKPMLYVACGISGVIQHVAGIRDSQIIVAINKDAEAPIFEIADYMVVGDLYEIVPALSSALRSLLKDS
jgi:electron transfer flavoprotein alpha subunit